MSKRQKAAKFGESAPTIHRPRLVQDLEEQLKSRRLILVIAPPGYGKSSMLVDFVETSDTPVCTIQLTEAARDPANLAERATSTLVKRFRRLRGAWDEPGSTDEPVLAKAIGEALAGQVPERHAIFIDGIEALQGATEAVAYLDELLENLPEQTTLVLAGRRLPALSLAELVAADLVKSYSAVELTLDFDEMVELVELRTGEAIDQARADQLYQRTEGWVTGVMLSEEVQPAFVTAGIGRSLVDEYFHAAAFEGESDELTRFLLESSLLPVFNADLCDHVLGCDDSQAMIDQLLRSGCYLFHEGYYPERFFRYQRQYQRFLKGRADISAERVEQILGRAVEWYEQHQLPEFAFDLSIDLEDFQEAVRIANDYASEVYDKGKYGLIRDWGKRLRQFGQHAPNVYRVVGQTEAYGGNTEQAIKWINLAKEQLSRISDPFDQSRLLITEFLINRDFEIGSDPHDLINQLKELLPSIPSDKRDSYYATVLEYQIGPLKDLEAGLDTFELIRDSTSPIIRQRSLNNRGMALGLQGRLLEAKRDFEGAYRACIDNKLSFAIPTALNNLAVTNHFLGRYFEAASYYRHSLDNAINTNREHDTVWNSIGYADLYRDLFLFEAADGLYERALELAESSPNPRSEALAKVCYARSLRLNGRPKRANSILHEIQFSESSWRFQCDVAIEKVHSQYPNNPSRRLEFLRDLREANDLTKLDEIKLDIEVLKSLLEINNGDEAVDQLVELLEAINGTGIYHWLAVEAVANKYLLEFIQSHGSEHASRVLVQVEEIHRARNLFSMSIENVRKRRMHLRSLGKLEIRSSSGALVELRAGAIELLFYILDNESVETDEVANVMWPESPPERQASNLHASVYQIRKALGSEIITTKSGRYVVSDRALSAYDVRSFEQMAKDVNRSMRAGTSSLGLIEEALSLYRGEFLKGFFSNWIVNRREDLKAIYFDLLHSYTKLSMLQKTPDYAIGHLKEVIREHKLSGELSELYIDALLDASRNQEAVAYYRQYEKRLAEELQLKPESRIRNNVERAMNEAN